MKKVFQTKHFGLAISPNWDLFVAEGSDGVNTVTVLHIGRLSFAYRH